MAVERIIEEKCLGCRTCVLSCPMDVFRLNDENRKAIVRYPEECVMCCICIADCPADAIEATKGRMVRWLSSGY